MNKKNLSINKTFELAVENQQKGNLKVAEKLYQEILKADPNHIASYNNLGQLFQELREHNKAKNYYEKALQINPNHPITYNNLGVLFYNLKDYQKAKNHYEKAIQLDPNYVDALSNIGGILIKIGKFQEAKSYYEKAIQIKPNHADAHYNLGVVFKALGEYQKAINCYEKAIQINPNHVDAHYGCGLLFQSSNKYQEHKKAISYYEKVIKINPNHIHAHNNLGLVFFELGKLQEAKNCCQKAIDIKSDYAIAYYNLGNILKALREPQKAKECYEKAIQINPNDAAAHGNLGSIFKELGGHQKAKECYEKAIEIQPNHAKAHNSLGAVFKDLEETEKAKACYEKAIEIDPNHADAYSNLGVIFKELGELQKAKSWYEKAIQINPNHTIAHNNLGIVFQELGEFQKARYYCEKAIQINPSYVPAHINLGVVLRGLGDHQKSKECYEKAIQINPSYAAAHNNLGTSQTHLGKFAEAMVAYRQAIKIKPDYAEVYSNLLLSLHYETNFDPNLYLSEAKKFRSNCKPKKKLSFHYQYDQDPKKLKIGFVSSDFGNHPGGFFSLSTLRELKKKNFDLIAYSNFDRKDEFAHNFKSLFLKWHSIQGKKDEIVVKQIVKDGIHILIDSQGHSSKNRLPIFMYRPAPVQVSWLGQGSTGIPEIDYLIGSPYAIPKDEEKNYVEEIFRLPETSQCFTPPDFDVKINSLPAIKNNFITFGCLNKLEKVNDEVIDLWSKILLSIPNSKLLIKSKNLDDQNIVEDTYLRFEKKKINKDFLILRGRSNTRKEVLEIYNDIDIALDPFPFRGNTCTCESVWMGVPVITLKGKNMMMFHQGESINSNLNMQDWIAESHEAYVTKAIEFSSNLDHLSKIRMYLRKEVLQSPVCDASRFAQHFDKMLWEMWKNFILNTSSSEKITN